MQTYSVPLVKQIVVDTGKEVLVCRYDQKQKLLFQQNRSRDANISVQDFVIKLNETVNVAKSKGYKIKISEVPAGSTWNVKI